MAGRPWWFWCLFPAVTMSLGWGLRGYIGGGPLGAMIPGAMLGLAVCLLLGRRRHAGLVAAFAAIGVGFGGQETYGQTVGLAFQPETYAWAITGFALKGGIWGLLGGALLGIALARDRFRNQDLIAAFALMITGTYAGWKLINEPKLIYFSNLYDRPRAELWAGLLLGAILLLAWLALRAGERIPLRFAIWGLLGGGVGFASGAALQVWGRAHWPDFPVGWWKMMEFTFGACLGLGYGICAWRLRPQLVQQDAAPSPPTPLVSALAFAALAIAVGIHLQNALPTRLDYTVVGALLLGLALFSEALCWQIAVTLTYHAFAVDLLRNQKELPSIVLWTFVLVTTAIVAAYVARRPHLEPMFLLLTLSAVGMSVLKAFLAAPPLLPQLPTEGVFVLMALALAIALHSAHSRRLSPTH